MDLTSNVLKTTVKSLKTLTDLPDVKEKFPNANWYVIVLNVALTNNLAPNVKMDSPKMLMELSVPQVVTLATWDVLNVPMPTLAENVPLVHITSH